MGVQNLYFRTSLKYGIIGGGLVILLFIVLVLTDTNPLIVNRRLDFGFIIIPVIVFFSIKEFRDYWNNKELRYWQGMTIGFLTFVVLAAFSALSLWLFLTFFSSELLNQYIDDRVALLVANREFLIESFSEETYQQTLTDLEGVTPWILAVDDFFKKILTGFFVTVIISVILRR